MGLQILFLVFKPLKSKLLAFDEAFTCYTSIERLMPNFKIRFFCIFKQTFKMITRLIIKCLLSHI